MDEAHSICESYKNKTRLNSNAYILPFIMRKVDVESKLPPQDIDIEDAVLGAILLEKDAFEKVNQIISKESFYKETNAIIFEAVNNLHTNKSKIDLLTVTAELRKMGKLEDVGGAFAVTQLAKRVASAANIEYHAFVISEMHMSRKLIEVCSEGLQEAFDESTDIFEQLDTLLAKIEAVKNIASDIDHKPFDVEVNERIIEKERMVKEGVPTGLSTGNEFLDKHTGGFVKSNLWYIAARPAMGKTVKMMQYATQVASKGNPIAVFSLEMSSKELIDRLIVAETNIPLTDYRANKLTQYDLNRMKEKANKIASYPIAMYDKSAIKPIYIRSKIRQTIKKFGSCKAIFIDYLQLMHPNEKQGTREREVASVSAELKSIAKDFDIPVICLVQMGRATDKSGDRRPTLDGIR